MKSGRIVVGIDASAGSYAALESAAGLAVGGECELLGLFVEDIELVRFAALPFASEVLYPSDRWHAVDPESMSRMLRATARRARQALADVAGRRGVRWSFRTTPGPVDQILLDAAETSDLIVLGAAGMSARVGRRTGSTARRVASRSRGSVLLLSSRRRSGAVAALYTEPEVSLPSVAAATSLAASRSQALVVLVEAAEGEGVLRREEEARSAVGTGGVKTRFRSVVRPDPGRLLQAVEEEGCSALVLAATDSRLQGDRLDALLREISVDLLIVR